MGVCVLCYTGQCHLVYMALCLFLFVFALVAEQVIVHSVVDATKLLLFPSVSLCLMF